MIRVKNFQTMGVSHSFEYLGESLHHRRVVTISLDGIIVSSEKNDGGLTDNSPLYDIWDETDNIRNDLSDFQDIYVNDILLGRGRITSHSFPEHRDPSIARHSVSIEIYKEGDMSSLSESEFRGWSADSHMIAHASSIGETFTFERRPDGLFDYQRSISFTLIDPGGGWDLYTKEDFLERRSYFFGDPMFELLDGSYPNFYDSQGERNYTETHNHITGEYSFSESFVGPSEGKDYRWTHSISVEVDEQGATSVLEEGEVIGVRSPANASARLGMINVEATSPMRVASAYSALVGGCGDQLVMLSSSKSTRARQHSITYSFSYGLSGENVDGLVVTTTSNSSIDDSGIVTVQEGGKVSSKKGKIAEAMNYFNDEVSPALIGRAAETYAESGVLCGCDGSPATSSDLRLVQTSQTYSRYSASVEYNYTYTNKCEHIANGHFSVESEVGIRDTVHNAFLVVTPYDGEIAQPQNTSSLVQTSYSISVTNTGSTVFSVQDYLSAAYSVVSPPPGDFYILDSCDYTFSPEETRLTLELEYLSPDYREFNDIDV